MTPEEIIKKLKSDFPGKAVFPNSDTNPEEIICEVDSSAGHSDFSLAVAFIKNSVPHRHIKTVETYEVEDGKLDLFLDGVKKTLSVGQSYTINPGVIHWAEGGWTRVKVTSKPGWTPEDHIAVEKAVSAGGIVVKDGKILFVKFPSGEGVTFPKGHVEKGETYDEAATREVMEETGLGGVKVNKKMGMVTRPAIEKDGKVVIKDIHLFLMKTEGFVQGKADEETVWLSMEEALPRLFPQEADFLKTNKKLIDI